MLTTAKMVGLTQRWILRTLLVFLFTLPVRASLIRTLDGRDYHGEIVFAANALDITLGDASTVSVPLTNLLLVIFGSTATDLAQFGPLREGWRAQDIGDASIAGRAGQSGMVVAVKGAAAGTGEKSDSFHFVYHRVVGDGEIIARVTSIEGADRLAQASVMIRDRLHANSAFAAVGVSANGTLSFQSRSEAAAKARAVATNQVSLPRWVRLVKAQKQFTAYHSLDGLAWEEAGASTIDMGDTVFFGLACASHSNFALSVTTLDHVRLIANGLRGEYFADSEFHDLKFTRIDPQIRFAWGLGPPADGLPNDHFSVRWTGQIRPKYSEDYTFYFDATERAQLWIDQKPILAVPFRVEPQKRIHRAAVPLLAGHRYDLKMEFREGDGTTTAHLGWSSRSQPRETIPARELNCSFSTDAANPATNAPAAIGPVAQAKGLLLRDGTFIAGQVQSLAEASVKFSFRGQQNLVVPMHKVARVLFRLPRRGQALELGRSGVLLSNGDFFESEIKKIDARGVKVSSVLFGLRHFDLDDVAAVIYNAVSPPPVHFEVRTTDGSALLSTSLSFAGGEVSLDEPALGRMQLQPDTIVEIRRR
jgi:hypothetical protein